MEASDKPVDFRRILNHVTVRLSPSFSCSCRFQLKIHMAIGITVCVSCPSEYLSLSQWDAGD